MFIKRIVWSLIFGMGFVIPASLIWAVDAQALAPDSPQTSEDCRECHSITYSHWAEGQHSQAYSDDEFQQAWITEGYNSECLACHITEIEGETETWVEEGVSCLVCHQPISDSHPDSVMPTDISSRMCGECHVDTYKDWEESAHSESDLTCVQCHDSHSASLKKESSSETCETCHGENVHFLPYSAHGGTDLDCIDCHLQVTDSKPGEGHGTRHHTLVVSLDICADCHAEEMHGPIASVELTPIESGLIPGIDDLSEQPPSQMSLQIVLVAGLIGMAAGLILAPWLERAYEAKISMR